jgi:DNA-directed RNA polymerase subunit E'/Rpb7
MDNVYYRVLLNDRIKIAPKFLSKDYRSHILEKLKKTVEGVCTKHGYIKEGSVELYKVAPGSIELIGLNGYILFEVYYYADVCNPLIGNLIKATVSNVNKFGILAEVGGILEIIIAKNSVNITHDTTIDLEQIKIGDTVQVEVIGKKFELNDKKISIVGKIVSGKSTTLSSRKKERDAKEKEEDEDDIPQDDVEVGSSESESDDEGKEESDETEDSEDLNDIDNENEEDEEFHKGGNEFFESDDEDDFDAENAYELYSDDGSYAGSEADEDEY